MVRNFIETVVAGWLWQRQRIHVERINQSINQSIRNCLCSI